MDEEFNDQSFRRNITLHTLTYYLYTKQTIHFALSNRALLLAIHNFNIARPADTQTVYESFICTSLDCTDLEGYG